MSNLLHAFDFLESAGTETTSPFYVLFGDDGFLQLLARKHLLEQLGGGEADFDVAVIEGDSAHWPDIFDELTTASLFSQGSGRTVFVESADNFVKKFRGELRIYWQVRHGVEGWSFLSKPGPLTHASIKHLIGWEYRSNAPTPKQSEGEANQKTPLALSNGSPVILTKSTA